jgi:hypothetical protein
MGLCALCTKTPFFITSPKPLPAKIKFAAFYQPTHCKYKFCVRLFGLGGGLMRWIYAVLVLMILLFGCVNISESAKAVQFGQKTSEQKAYEYFKSKYGSPEGPGSPRILEPMMTTFIDSNFMPADKVLKYNKNAPAFYLWFFYDNFATSDEIKVTFRYLEDGTDIYTFKSKGGGDYGAANFKLESPDGGWPLGKYEAVISGKGVTERVPFEVIEGETVKEALPYEQAGIKPPETKEKQDSGKAQTTAAMTSDKIVFETTPGYLGACMLTDTSSFRLSSPIDVSLLQIWYKWDEGESQISYILQKDGQEFLSGVLVRADCDPYQKNWCNGNQKISKVFPAGEYKLAIPVKKMCLQPGKTGMVRLYGKAYESPASTCNIIGDWKWFNHDHVYMRPDGTLDAWNDGKKTEYGTWKKNSDGSYTLYWNLGWVDSLTLSSDCKKLSGKNQQGVNVWGTKISDNVPEIQAETQPAVPSDVPAHISSCNYAGKWETDWGTMVLAQQGNKVTGNYTWDSGKVSGTIVDGVFVGTWSEAPSYAPDKDAGDLVFYFTKDCNSFSGNWNYGTHKPGTSWSGTWVGKKVS